MSRTAPATSVAQPAVYYDYQKHHHSPQLPYQYPSVSAPQRPRALQHGLHKNSAVEISRIDVSYEKNSVSSAASASASTAGSDLRPYLPPQAYRFGSQAERGLIEESVRHSHVPSQQRNIGTASSYIHSEMVEDNSAVFRYIRQQEIAGNRQEAESDHAVRILIWLAFFDPLHCIFSAIYSICTLVVLVIISPIRLCRSQSSFSTSLIRIIAPVFRNHLQMLHAPSVDNAHTFEFSSVYLILVHVTSPLLSLGVAVASWIAAVFWLFAIAMGNPDGTERRDDGRATVLMVRNWWEKYLLNAVRG